MRSEKSERILCVDDEPNVLEGLGLHLRRRYDVVTATSGKAALELLAKSREVAVIVSDMRMPGMDGATFLRESRLVAPDATRVLLSGHADVDSAVAAVNEGQIFRFLTKPCPPPQLLSAIEAGVEQHRLVTAERILLEQTLHGSIEALTAVLALTSPMAFGRAELLKRLASDLAIKRELPDRWQVEVAAMLSQLACVSLPAETAEKVYYGQPLTEQEQAMVSQLPAVTEKLLAHIPRLEAVREILALAARPRRPPVAEGGLQTTVARASEILRVAIDFDALLCRGTATDVAIGVLRGRTNGYDAEVLAALAQIKAGGAAHAEVRELPLALLRVGMVVAEDLRMTSGTLLATKGYEITSSFVERARNFRSGSVNEPVRVFVPRSLP